MHSTSGIVMELSAIFVAMMIFRIPIWFGENIFYYSSSGMVECIGISSNLLVVNCGFN